MRDNTMYAPLISIIIPTFNSMTGNKCLDRVLTSILNQTYKNWEIIVVDNYSTDETKEICGNFPVRFFELRSSRSIARNFALSKSKGEYMLFLDSDMVLPATLLEECIILAKDKHADCISVEDVYIGHRKSKLYDLARLHNIEMDLGIASDSLTDLIFYSKSVIQGERFPDNVNLGEDHIFASKIVKKKNPNIRRIKSKVIHFHNPTFKGVINRSWRYGFFFKKTEKLLGLREGLHFLTLISVFRIKTLKKINVIIRLRPQEAILFFIYLLVKYFSFLFGYLTYMFSEYKKDVES